MKFKKEMDTKDLINLNKKKECFFPYAVWGRDFFFH